MINVLAVRVSIKFNLEEFLSNFVVLNCLQNRSAVYYNILGTKVKVDNKKVSIYFENVNDLNRILEIMNIEIK